MSIRNPEAEFCGAIEFRDGREWICEAPRNHIKLQVVREGDKPSKFAKPVSAHYFVNRRPTLT